MCRFFIYKGKMINLNVLFEQNNSILKQSIHIPFTPFVNEINNRDHEVNGDGFGICWEKNKKIYFYKSSRPPWNDINIINLSKYIESNLFLCHIRAIKPFSNSSCVHEYNCHPFIYNHFSWMHNGDIKNKSALCKYLYENCDLDLLKNIKGNTDSEYCFYIFLSLLDKDILSNKKKLTQQMFKNKMIDTINIIIKITQEVISLNFCVYDGKTIIITRFINSKKENPPSLYYSKNLNMFNNYNYNTIISSEPITKNKSDWNLIPKNKLLILSQRNKIIIKNINF